MKRDKNKELARMDELELVEAIVLSFEENPDNYTDRDEAIAWEIFDRVADGRLRLVEG